MGYWQKFLLALVIQIAFFVWIHIKKVNVFNVYKEAWNNLYYTDDEMMGLMIIPTILYLLMPFMITFSIWVHVLAVIGIISAPYVVKFFKWLNSLGKDTETETEK